MRSSSGSDVGFVSSGDVRHPVRDVDFGGDKGRLLHKTTRGDAESLPQVEVEAGTFLLDVEKPVVVGFVVKPAELAELGEGTLWGPIPVRLAPVPGRCGGTPETP